MPCVSSSSNPNPGIQQVLNSYCWDFSKIPEREGDGQKKKKDLGNVKKEEINSMAL